MPENAVDVVRPPSAAKSVVPVMRVLGDAGGATSVIAPSASNDGNSVAVRAFFCDVGCPVDKLDGKPCAELRGWLRAKLDL